MRKILIFILIALTGCERSLDLSPKMFVSAAEAFSSRENVQAALIGCYDALQLQHYYGRNLIIVGDLASDNSEASGTKIEYYSVNDNNLLADNILVEGIWRDIYTGINRTNYVLHKLEEIEFLDDDELMDYRGQLYFLRALHYFNLVRLYGGVPLMTGPTTSADPDNFRPRSTTDQVYARIQEDLDAAIRGIKNSDTQYATSGAARALLSLVELTMGNYGDALLHAEEAFEAIGSLEDDYARLFAQSTEPSREILFHVPFNPSDKNRLAEYHLPNQLGGRYENSPSEKLVGRTGEDDSRKQFIAAHYQDKYYTNKYSDLHTGSDRVIVLRAAELLFIKAEANYYIDSVGNLERIVEDINTVRSRARLAPLENIPVGLIWNMIERERQLEFAFEGKRWFDLIRTDRALGTVPTVTSGHQTLFPVPLSEILSNPFIGFGDQNDGY
jgi:hypothetical protein